MVDIKPAFSKFSVKVRLAVFMLRRVPHLGAGMYVSFFSSTALFANLAGKISANSNVVEGM